MFEVTKLEQKQTFIKNMKVLHWSHKLTINDVPTNKMPYSCIPRSLYRKTYVFWPNENILHLLSHSFTPTRPWPGLAESIVIIICIIVFHNEGRLVRNFIECVVNNYTVGVHFHFVYVDVILIWFFFSVLQTKVFSFSRFNFNKSRKK